MLDGMVSTPNAPDGLFEHIEKEDEETCLYKRLLLDYTFGLGKIYPQEEIDKAKASPSFEREYNLKYLGLIGNVFHTRDIEAAIQKGTGYSPFEINDYSQKSMGIDPAFGSSAFGIVVTQRADNQIQIMHAEEYEARLQPDAICSLGPLQEIWQNKQDIHRWLQPIIHTSSENTDRRRRRVRGDNKGSKE